MLLTAQSINEHISLRLHFLLMYHFTALCVMLVALSLSNTEYFPHNLLSGWLIIIFKVECGSGSEHFPSIHKALCSIPGTTKITFFSCQFGWML